MDKWRLKGISALDYEAVQLTSENVKEVTAWCNGLEVQEIDSESGKTYVGINVPCLQGNRRASEGMYVIRGSGIFDVVPPDLFEHLYERVSE